MKTELLVIMIILIIGSIGGYLFMQNKNSTKQQETKLSVLGDKAQNEEVTPTSVPLPSTVIDPSKTYNVILKTSMGDITIELDAKAAPLTTNNFVYLSKSDFYDNTVFHRVIKGFMIQGGDPEGNGTGGPGYTIPAEIGLKHTRGVISMARLPDQVNPKKESSGSQFFIMHQDSSFLDGEYTAFGKVTEGMEVVDKIAEVPVTTSASGEQSQPSEEVKILDVEVVEK